MTPQSSEAVQDLGDTRSLASQRVFVNEYKRPSRNLSESIGEQRMKPDETDQQAFSTIAYPVHLLKNPLPTGPIQNSPTGC
jgi:hypothetical protein